MLDISTTEKNESEVRQLDPSQIAHLKRQLEADQKLLLGVIGGAVGSLAGAGIWAAITFTTGYQIGFVAIGIGFLVGFGFRSFGKGVTMIFGTLSAGLSIAGCALGNLLAVCTIIATQENISLLSVLTKLNPTLIQELMVATFSPMDLIFYGIAAYFGYKLAFRQVTEEDLNQMLARRPSI